MDPNTALKNIRDLSARLNQGGMSAETAEVLGSELAESVEGLDQWLSSGGFLPEEWQPSVVVWLREQEQDILEGTGPDGYDAIQALIARMQPEPEPAYTMVTVKVRVREGKRAEFEASTDEHLRALEDDFISGWHYEGPVSNVGGE